MAILMPTVVRSSYLHNGISYTRKMSFSYWIRAQMLALYEIVTGMWRLGVIIIKQGHIDNIFKCSAIIFLFNSTKMWSLKSNIYISTHYAFNNNEICVLFRMIFCSSGASTYQLCRCTCPYSKEPRSYNTLNIEVETKWLLFRRWQYL